MLVRRKALLLTAVSVLVIGVLAVSVIGSAYALGVPPPPSLFIRFTQKPQLVGDGCPAVYTALLFPQGGSVGEINLTATNLPNGVVATFAPNPVMTDPFAENTTYMLVVVSPTVPHGNYTIHIEVTPLSAAYNKTYFLGVDGDTSLALNIGSCAKTQNQTATATTTLTQTSISTSTTTMVTSITRTLTTTVPSTITAISTEKITELSTYAWALSATVATIVLAAVMLIQRRRTK